jgi:hypothetical protein
VNAATDHLTMLRRELEIVMRHAAEEAVVVIPPVAITVEAQPVRR